MEGLGGDAGELRDLRVGEPRIALVQRQVHDRAEHARPLVVAGQEGRRRGRDALRAGRAVSVRSRSADRDPVGLDPVEHFVGQPVELLVALLEHAREHDVADAGDDRPGGQLREDDALGGELEGGRDDALEREAGELHPFPGLRADAERVDQHQVRALGRVGGVVEQDLAGGVQAVGPAALCLPGLEHPFAGVRHDDVVGAEEALFLVREQLVEGPPRDAGQADHVGDGRGLVATLRDGLDHAAVEAAALIAFDLVPAHTVRSVRKPAVERCDLVLCSTHPHNSET